MLGIRAYKGLSIDLWQGPAMDFSTDIICIPFQKKSEENTNSHILMLKEYAFPANIAAYAVQTEDHLFSLNAYEETLKMVLPLGFRHLTFAPIKENSKNIELDISLAKKNLSFLHEALKKVSLEKTCLKRISFILQNSSQHDIFQTALFSEFKEDPLSHLA